MLPFDIKNRKYLEATDPGPIHGWPVVTTEPSFQNIFNGNGKLITRIGILVRYLAEHCISDSGPESS